MRMARGPRLWPLVAATVMLALLGACAVHPPAVPPPPPGELRARYAAALARRQAALEGVSVDLSVWTTIGTRRQPGVEAGLAIGGPETLRFRVASLFGTGLDVGLRGSDLLAYAPGERAVLALDASAPPLGFEAPGALMANAWSGAWRPPASAWSRGEYRDSVYVVGWVMGADSVRLAIGPSGLPHRVAIVRGQSSGFEITYLVWGWRDGMSWPMRIDCRDDAGRFFANVRVRSLRLGALSSDRLRPDPPEDARRVTWEEFAEMLHLDDRKS